MIPMLVAISPTLPSLCPRGHAKVRQDKRFQASNSFLPMRNTRSKHFKGVWISHAQRRPHKAGICAASLNATCAAEQTQTVKRESSKITISPFQGTHTPKLDDGGNGSPPMDRGDGGGGGGGGGSESSGGFFLFGFLLFLSYLRDQDEELAYRNRR